MSVRLPPASIERFSTSRFQRTGETSRSCRCFTRDLTIQVFGSITLQDGTVTASMILRKLAAYPRQNGLALALRESDASAPSPTLVRSHGLKSRMCEPHEFITKINRLSMEMTHTPAQEERQKTAHTAVAGDEKASGSGARSCSALPHFVG
jgi:hypothetical protein